MKNNKSTVIWTVVIFLVLVGLFLYPKLTAPKNGLNNINPSSELACLLPNVPLAQHLHPHLQILVDGKEEVLPADIGLSPCHKPLHTHEPDGIIHVESQDTKDYTLGQFFGVWKKSIDREGYLLEATVQGKTVSDPASIVLKDEEEIVLKYIKMGQQ